MVCKNCQNQTNNTSGFCDECGNSFGYCSFPIWKLKREICGLCYQVSCTCEPAVIDTRIQIYEKIV